MAAGGKAASLQLYIAVCDGELFVCNKLDLCLLCCTGKLNFCCQHHVQSWMIGLCQRTSELVQTNIMLESFPHAWGSL
jgi:hypothetical protein